jgi:hypothetical protein
MCKCGAPNGYHYAWCKDADVTDAQHVMCFFCGHKLSRHERNKVGHPWRRSDRATDQDLRHADALTRAACGDFKLTLV